MAKLVYWDVVTGGGNEGLTPDPNYWIKQQARWRPKHLDPHLDQVELDRDVCNWVTRVVLKGVSWGV